MEIVLLRDEEISFPLESNPYEVDLVLERGIHHGRALETLKILENFGVRTLNSAACAEICGNKFLVTEALEAAQVPTPRSGIAFTRETALQMIEELGYPVVLKPAIGSWGTLLAKVNDRDAAEAVLDHKQKLGSYHHNVFYIQEFIDKPGRDIRVIVIGGEAVGAVLRKSAHWITHLDQGATLERCEMTTDLGSMAVSAAEAVGGEIVAVDIVESERGYLVLEVEYTVEFSQFSPFIDEQKVAVRIVDQMQKASDIG